MHTIVCNLELSVCTGALGVDNTLWNTLAIEVGEEVDQVEILEQQWAIWSTGSLVCLSMLDWSTIGGGVDWLLVILESRRWLLIRTHDGCCVLSDICDVLLSVPGSRNRDDVKRGFAGV